MKLKRTILETYGSLYSFPEPQEKIMMLDAISYRRRVERAATPPHKWGKGNRNWRRCLRIINRGHGCLFGTAIIAAERLGIKLEIKPGKTLPSLA